MIMQKKYNKVITQITTLTSDMSQSLLEGQFKGEQQRKLSENHIIRYADAISRDLWLFDAMPIRVDWFGRMFDGQHRCLAVLRTNKSMKVLIVYGLDPEVYKVCDRGKPRTFGDALRRNGELYYRELASALMMLLEYKDSRAGNYSGGSKFSSLTQTQDILKLLEENPNLRISAKRVMPARFVISPSIGTFLHHLFSQKDEKQANVFFDKLANGEGFKVRDPIGVLRDRLLFNKSEPIKMNREYKIAIVIKAWNIFRQDGQIKKLLWKDQKNSKETMPEIK